MRLLVLNWRDILSPEAGGAEVHLHEVLRRLVARGHTATLVCSRFAGRVGPTEEVLDGIKILRTGAWWNAQWTVPRFARQLLKTESFDLLLDDVNKIPFFAPLWSPIPVVAFFHHLLGTSVFLETNPLFASAIWAYERRAGNVYRETDVVAVSQSTARELESLGLSPSRITLVPPGLDQTKYHPAPTRRKGPPQLVVVSRLKRYKRVDVAIRALALIRRHFPDASLDVIGEGEQRPVLEALAKSLNQPVRFLGFVDEATKVARLQAAHVALQPSTKEGWGMAGIEAMACGALVVASDVPGHVDSIPEGVGCRVPAGSPDAMAAAACRFLSDHPGVEDVHTRARAWSSRFDWDDAADAIENILRKTRETAARAESFGSKTRTQAHISKPHSHPNRSASIAPVERLP